MKRLFTLLIIAALAAGCAKSEQTDVLIVGGGASGVSAGISAARMGVRTLIAEPLPWLGGMLTSAGVSCVDGNIYMRAGLFGEFLGNVEAHYGGADKIQTGWVSYAHFSPSVGNDIFQRMTAAEPNLEVWHGAEFIDARPTATGWRVRLKTAEGLKTVEAKVLIDGTELGDVAKAAGVTYDLGMEAASATGEDIAPAEANHIIQDLTWAMTLKDYHRDVTIEKPANYDPAEFACAAENARCVTPLEPDRMWSPQMMITYGAIPGEKFMINWPIEGNDYYVDVVEMAPAEREKALQPAKDRSMRFLYFIQTELGMNTLGLADDEFPTQDGLALMPYHRESRRIHGLVRFVLPHITDPYSATLYRTSIAVGDYPIDHHHARYTGTEKLPNLYFHPVPSYGLPLGTLLPRGVENLIVAEKSISVSNIVNGATRVQPVVMQIGQAAGALAALAVERGVKPSDVPVRDVQRAILAAGGYLQPYLDVPPTDPSFGALQRVGSTGILKGEGRSAGWSNQTWFRASEPLTEEELRGGLTEFYGADGVDAALEKLALTLPLTRGEAAVRIDTVLDPFNAKNVDITGAFVIPNEREGSTI